MIPVFRKKVKTRFQNIYAEKDFLIFS